MPATKVRRVVFEVELSVPWHALAHVHEVTIRAVEITEKERICWPMGLAGAREGLVK
jgi:hypothetical protein